MVDVVGIGLACVDLLVVVPEYPKEDTKMPAELLAEQGGGPVTTALVALSKLGLKTAYLGTIADDSRGQIILNELSSYGVDTTHVRSVANTTSTMSVVVISEVGKTRTIIWKRGSVRPPFPNELADNVIRQARVLHLDGHHVDAALYAANQARQGGVKVCLDAGNVFPQIEKLVSVTDLLIASEDFVLGFAVEKDPTKAVQRIYKEYRPEIVVVTQGERGGFYFDGANLTTYPSFEVEVVDTTGAGDVFHGAYIYGYLQNWSSAETARFASAVSALKCTKLGGRSGIPTVAETNRFLRNAEIRNG